MQRLFGQQNDENAIREMNNLLAAKPVFEVSHSDVASIEKKYGVSLQQEFALNLEEFYAVYLNHCLQDENMEEDRLRDLTHLRHLFQLSDSAVAMLHQRLGTPAYKRMFERAVADGVLSDAQQASLEKFQSDIMLPSSLADPIADEAKSNALQSRLKKTVKDQRLSPAERDQVEELMRKLRMGAAAKQAAWRQLKPFQEYWELENMELPVIDAPTDLQKSERCHFQAQRVGWHEFRLTKKPGSVQVRPTASFYMKSEPNAAAYAGYITLIDTGTLYLTDKRIIFEGASKSTSIKLDKIVRTYKHEKGIEIDKETGKSPYLELGVQTVQFDIMLARLMTQV